MYLVDWNQAFRSLPSRPDLRVSLFFVGSDRYQRHRHRPCTGSEQECPENKRRTLRNLTSVVLLDVELVARKQKRPFVWQVDLHAT